MKCLDCLSYGYAHRHAPNDMPHLAVAVGVPFGASLEGMTESGMTTLGSPPRSPLQGRPLSQGARIVHPALESSRSV